MERERRRWRRRRNKWREREIVQKSIARLGAIAPKLGEAGGAQNCRCLTTIIKNKNPV